MPFESYTDIGLTYDGDIMLSNGDFETVTGVEWAKRELNKILRTDNPDWNLHPNVGADLGDYRGRVNSRETADEIRENIVRAMVAQGFHHPEVIEVRVIPVGLHSIQVYIDLYTTGERVNIGSFRYQFGVGVIAPTEDLTNVSLDEVSYTRRHSKNTNKYLKRIQ